jgi:hypothetical protein
VCHHECELQPGTQDAPQNLQSPRQNQRCVNHFLGSFVTRLSNYFLPWSSLLAAYQSSPAHIEIIVEEKNEEIVKEKEEVVLKLSKKQLAQSKSKTIKVGGGV